jgi:ABC-type uncharacterized transport system permease subunit
MDKVVSVAFTLGVVGYSAAATLFFADLARRGPSPILVRWAPRMLAFGAVFHGAHVTIVSLLTRSCPVGSLRFALSLVGLVAVAGYLFLRRREHLHAIGAVVAPTALTLLIAADYIGAGSPAGSLNRALLTFHVTANLLGLAMFVLAATAGLLYLIQERRLRRKRMVTAASKLPPLDVLDTTLHRLLLVGFPWLTLGLVTGALVASHLESGSLADAARAILAYTTWLVFAAVLVFRRVAGWRGRRAAYGAIAGTVCILIVIALYIVTPTVGDGL